MELIIRVALRAGFNYINGGSGAAQIVHFPILEEMKAQCVKSCGVLATDMTTINLLTLRKLQKLKEEKTMKPSEPDIIDVECNDMYVKEVKKMVYRDSEIYAVKRSTAYSDAECALLDITNRAWWCGYVEVPLDMRNSFQSKGYLDDSILYEYELDNPKRYNLAGVHGGYTYIDYGIPRVLVGDQRIFLGWDYNHCYDTEAYVTYNDVINEGKRVVDSMLEKIKKENSNG